ncbi:hypothetical protein GCM10007962_07490 [Yeosuana aromativorans]|uniref:Secretion system C-terminal sorting domain-containing protein n=1 Tax=Yeosuana aromativorans TaxID=288019 RepID=A0A8J3BEF3_9FLAO|nr:leucine-rich repeat domain-containing protein [Yeosuana aromativorans]GGK15726.1 hypothetical protein GCM10007962_07490 [Yeosuana aromativorans]
MKTKLLTLILALLSFANYTQTYIEDLNFEAYLEANSMGDGIAGNHYVTTSNINTVENLDISGLGIQSMIGIEDFAALKTLNCSSNNLLQTLNVFNNIALTELRCFNCDITSLTLPNNNLLSYLSCGNNNLTGLDVSSYPLLTYLACSNNGSNNLGTLDLSMNTNLITLYCQNSGVSGLDISQSPNLDLLVCYDNSFPTLDISGNTALSEIRCYNSGINTFTIANSNYTNLTYLDCSDNPIGSLNLSYFPNLETLYCAYNNLNTLNVSTNTQLVNFGCWNNNLSSLDVSNNSLLNYFECGNNTLLSNNLILPTNKTALTSLWVYNIGTSSLNYSDYLQLVDLDIGLNNFTTADVSMLQFLNQFYCNGNQLTSLDISNGHNDTLTWMWAQNNGANLCIQVDDLVVAGGKSSPQWQRDIGSTFSLNCTLGSNEFDLSQVMIHPNPANDRFYIDLPIEANYTLSNMFGQFIRKGALFSGKNELAINALKSGLYLLNLESAQGRAIKKIIKK